MFFLIRVAFWLSVVILLLPTGPTQQAEGEPSIGVTDAFAAAAAAASDMRQFCVRQPDTCTFGSRAAQAFGSKAQASAKMVYEFFAEKNAGAHEPAVAGQTSGHAVTGEPRGQNTLSEADRVPAWRGPAPRPLEMAKGPA